MQKNTNSSNPIVFEHVGKIFGSPEDTALRDVTFTIEEGEFACFVGPSGAGKSTVLKIIAGLETQSSGKVEKPERVGMVFQSGALFPWLTVFDNVALGLRVLHIPESAVRNEVDASIAMMGLTDFFDKYPRELSGGQRQRVGIARAIALDPMVLLLDEPFSSLDIKTSEELHKDILTIWRQRKKTIVMVSHSIEEAVALADRVIVMNDFTVRRIVPIELPRPRHDQGPAFHQEVLRIRKEFF